jgi:hypothetical protein
LFMYHATVWAATHLGMHSSPCTTAAQEVQGNYTCHDTRSKLESACSTPIQGLYVQHVSRQSCLHNHKLTCTTVLSYCTHLSYQPTVKHCTCRGMPLGITPAAAVPLPAAAAAPAAAACAPHHTQHAWQHTYPGDAALPWWAGRQPAARGSSSRAGTPQPHQSWVRRRRQYCTAPAPWC